jgi:ribosomal protein S18 acetylase RimI-like enzyme
MGTSAGKLCKGMSMKIRPMRADDLTVIRHLIAEHSSYDAQYAMRVLKRELMDRARGNPRTRHLVAVRDKEVVGISGWEEEEGGGEGVFWLGWTYVHSDQRRHGVGTALLARVVDEIAKRRARKLYIKTGATGYEAALSFYEKQGFRQESRLPDFFADGEDCLILAWRLRKKAARRVRQGGAAG